MVIIFAAGEAKADMVKSSLESVPDAVYPATVLQRIRNGRFYLTHGAACKMTDTVGSFFKNGEWNHEKTERAVIDLCQKLNKYGHHLSIDDLKNDAHCSLIPNLSETTVQSVIDSIKLKMDKGMKNDDKQVAYHTGPHHDDVMLGIMQYTNRQVLSVSNEVHFSILTSGFTAVTNKFVIDSLNDIILFMDQGKIEMINYSDFFSKGYKEKWDKDVYNFLNGVADRNLEEKRRGLSHRLVQAIVDIWVIKGMVREFEEELVWAHYGVPVKNGHHLRLGFYKGDTFTEQPEKNRDMLPILEELRKFCFKINIHNQLFCYFLCFSRSIII